LAFSVIITLMKQYAATMKRSKLTHEMKLYGITKALHITILANMMKQSSATTRRSSLIQNMQKLGMEKAIPNIIKAIMVMLYRA